MFGWTRRAIPTTAFILTVLLPSTFCPAHTQTSADELLRRVVDEVIAPGYANLVQAAEAQQIQWQSFCPSPSAAALAKLRDAYHRTADAWSSIELVHYGPIAEDFRGERLSFWPERKNAVEKALKAALAKADAASLAPETFRKGSAAVQGLPALERLLFPKRQPKQISPAAR